MRCSDVRLARLGRLDLVRRGAEVGRDHGGIALDLLRRALGDLLAEVEHDDAVRDRHDQLHVVLDQQHTDVALGVDALDQLGQLALLDRVGAGGRLVQQQDAGVRAQRAGDLEATLLAVGKEPARSLARAASPTSSSKAMRLGALLLLATLPRQAEHRRYRTGPLPGLDADLDVLQRGQRREQPDVLERPGHARGG